MFKKTLTSLILFISILLFPSHGMENQESKIEHLLWGYTQFDSYLYSEQGELKGELRNEVSKIFNKANLSYEAIELPGKRLKKYLQLGKVDFSILIDSFIVDKDNFLRSERPLDVIKVSAISFKNIEINNFSDLRNYEIAIISGYTYGGNIGKLMSDEYSISVKVQNHKQGLLALKHQRADILIGYYKAIINQQNFSSSAKIAVLDEIPIYLFLNKNTENSKKVMNEINKAIANN